MRKLLSFLLVAVLALSLASCAKMQAKHQMHSLESLIEKVEKHGDSFTQQDWAEVRQEYDEICTKMNQCEYTDEELQEIGRLKGRFYAACAKKAFGNAGGLLNGLINQFGGAIDGFMEGLSGPEDEKAKEEANQEETDEILLGLESIF